jgi:cell division transport system ATP-binding protein
MVGLSGKASRLPHELSGGEQQRVAIARAVVNKPQVLLADEPTGNLDPATSAGIMAVLERINAAGTTVLMATHEAGIVDQMQRRVIELVSGQIVRDERHGGYGFTSAIPTTHGAVADAMGDTVTRNTAPVRLPTHVVTDLHAAELSAEAAAAAPPVLVPTRAAEAQPTPVAPESVVPEQSVPEPAAPAEAEQVPIEPTTETARLSAHFAAPPTQPVIRTQPLPDEELPEQLSLAEKLGLRAPGDDQDITGEQNVGPTK